MANLRCCHSRHEILGRNSSKPRRTAQATPALSRKVPGTAFKQKQANNTEIKSNVLLTDTARRVTALPLTRESCRSNSHCGSWTQWGCCAAPPDGQGARSRGKATLLHLNGVPTPQASPQCTSWPRRGCMGTGTGKKHIQFISSDGFFSNYGERKCICLGGLFFPL